MTIYELADIMNTQIIITYFPNQKGRFIAELEHYHIKEGNIIKGEFGTGKNPQEAIEDFVNIIKGKCLVTITFDETMRKEFSVPMSLTS